MPAQDGRYRVHDALTSALSGIQATGTFATRGTLPARCSDIDIGLTVKDVGEIKMPLEPDDPVFELLRAKSRDGSDAAKAANLRTENDAVMEIAANEITIAKQPLWNTWLQEKMIVTAMRNFGIASTVQIFPELRKLSMLEKDCGLEIAPESEKNRGEIGTLVVVLRSNHQGANTTVTYGDRTKKFSTDNHSYDRFQWLGWYTESHIEVKPVTFGVRMVLTYDLRLKSSPSAYLIHNEEDGLVLMKTKLEQVLRKWTSKPHVLLYQLERPYSLWNTPVEATDFPSAKMLVGNDRLRVQALDTIASPCGFSIFLSLMKMCKITRNSTSVTAAEVFQLNGEAVFKKIDLMEYDVAQRGHFLEGCDFVIGERAATYAILITPLQSISALKIRTWCVETWCVEICYHGWDYSREQVLNTWLELSRGNAPRPADPGTQQVLLQLLDNYEEYQNSQTAAHLKSMRLRPKDLETMAIIALNTGMTDIFRRTCEHLVEHNHTDEDKGRWKQLFKAMSLRCYHFGDAAPIDFYMGLSKDLSSTVASCERFQDAIDNAKALSVERRPQALRIDMGYLYRLWIRDALDKPCHARQRGRFTWGQCSDMIYVGCVLGNVTIASAALSHLSQNIYVHQLPDAGTIVSRIKSLVSRIDVLDAEVVFQYSMLLLLLLKQKDARVESILPEEIIILVQVGRHFAGDLAPIICEVVKAQHLGFTLLLTAIEEAMMHETWQAHCSDLFKLALHEMCRGQHESIVVQGIEANQEEDEEDECNGKGHFKDEGPSTNDVERFALAVASLSHEQRRQAFWDHLPDSQEFGRDLYDRFLSEVKLQMRKVKQANEQVLKG